MIPLGSYDFSDPKFLKLLIVKDQQNRPLLQYLYTLLVCLFVCNCLYPINVKTAESIGPNIFEETHMTPGRFMHAKNCTPKF